MQTINASQVQQKMNDGSDTVLIHSLSSKSFQTNRIPGSINIPAGNISDVAKQVLADPEQAIIVYCSNTNCSASTQAAQALKQMGYTNIYDFESGLNGWRSEGFDLCYSNLKKSVTD